MTRFLLLSFLTFLQQQTSKGFHVDSCPEHTRYTFLQRNQEPKHLQQSHEGKLSTQQLYSNQDRTWRFPDQSHVRQVGDMTLTSLTDRERLWRNPSSNQVRRSTVMGSYMDDDRMWRRPEMERMIKHEIDYNPEPLKDTERFWWKHDDFENLLLEDDYDDHDDESDYSHQFWPEQSKNLFRRPSSRFVRHPHSFDETRFESEVAVSTTMTPDDRLGWLTENTHKLLSEEEESGLLEE